MKNEANTEKVHPITPIPVFRRERQRSGFDMFRASEDPQLPEPIFRTVDDGRKIFDIGAWNTAAKTAYESLPREKQSEYEAAAANFKDPVNVEKERDPEVARALYV